MVGEGFQQLTLWAGLVNCNDGLLVGGVDGFKGLALNPLHELAVDEQAERLLVGDAGGLDLLCQRHDCGIEGMKKLLVGGITAKRESSENLIDRRGGTDDRPRAR